MSKKSRARTAAKVATGTKAPAASCVLPSPGSNAFSVPSGTLRDFALVALLFTITMVAYWPALHGGGLWDDDGHITKPELRSLHGLWRIWFEVGATQQYYPLLHSSFWIEHRLWGDAVFGYHLTNVFLHVGAACLVVAIMRRLALPGAWLGGFIFALHPVCVESVAWISEQKNTLSAVFYLSAALVYLHFNQQRRWSQYFLASGLFMLALLSKTVTATLPAALLVIFWWQRGRLSWKRDVLPLVPWFLFGVAGGLFSAWVERKFIGAEGTDFQLTLLERCLLAGRVVWFYPGKLIWPADLMFIYPHWTVSPTLWWQYLFPLGGIALAVGLCFMARQSRGPLAAFLFFAGTLFPVMGFFNVYPFVFSYVADHFQYLACLGLIVAFASGLTLAFSHLKTSSWFAPAVYGTLLTALALLTYRQSGEYRNGEVLYRSTLAKNPACWMAYNNLGMILKEKSGGAKEAISEYEAALRIRPDYSEAHNNLGVTLAEIPERLPEAIAEYQAALQIKPDYAEAHNNLGVTLADIPERLPEAIAEYEAALRIKPDYAEAHNNLGNALSQIPGRLPEAIAEYQAAVRINPDDAEAHYNLGRTLAQIPGRLSEAVAEYQAVLRINPGDAEAHGNLGSVLENIPGRLQDAIAQYEEALRINPEFAAVHYNLGLVLINIPGRHQDAIGHLKTALRINPDFVQAREALDQLQASQP
jgi:tetratricopeptide (TPR) repeat protein